MRAVSPRLRLLAPLVALVLLGGGQRAEGKPAADCPLPHELVEDDPVLPTLARRLHQHQPLTIVAIGGASTAGIAAGGDPANAYPHRLELALRRRHPGTPITVLNKGIGGQTTGAMVDRFTTDVYPYHPTLVIWETGIIEAARDADLEEFAAALEAGIAALQAHQTEVMLVDMQYNPGMASIINFEPYLDALRRTADLQDVYVFRRFDIMKYWSDAGVFDFVDVPKGHRAALATAVYRCLGESLADAIDFATRRGAAR